MEYDLDSNGGLMNQILALTAAPGSRDRSDSANGQSNVPELASSLSAHPYFKRPGRGHNRDCCDACGEGGDLICCDICPASFHLICHDPPLYEEDIPLGEWGCFQCQVTNNDDKMPGASRCGNLNLKLNRGIKRKERDDVPSKTPGKSDLTQKSNKRDKCDAISLENGTTSGSTSSTSNSSTSSCRVPLVNGHEMAVTESPFMSLVRHVATSNPKQFVLPYTHTVPIAFPGESKSIFRYNGRRGAAPKKKSAHDNGVALPAKLCFTCNKGCRSGALLCCDYCPLMFHLDCLDPPLTIAPTQRWMCPNHPEQFMDEHRVTTCCVSERVRLWERCRGLVDQAAVQRSFFNIIHRKRPPSRYKIRKALRKTIRVPEGIKDAYANPVHLLPALPPAHLRPPPMPTFPPECVTPAHYECLKTEASFLSADRSRGRNSSRESSSSEVHLPMSVPCSVSSGVTRPSATKELCSKDDLEPVINKAVSSDGKPSLLPITNSNCISKTNDETLDSLSAVSATFLGDSSMVRLPAMADTDSTSSLTSNGSGKPDGIDPLRVHTQRAKYSEKKETEADADTTLDSCSQISEDTESQKEISTEDELEDSGNHESEFLENRIKVQQEKIITNDFPDKDCSSKRKEKSWESHNSDKLSINECLLKECDVKERLGNNVKRFKLDKSTDRLIQTNGDINDKWNSLLDEPFENNNKIISKSRDDAKSENSARNNSSGKTSDNNDDEVCSVVPIEARLQDGVEMEVVTSEPATFTGTISLQTETEMKVTRGSSPVHANSIDYDASMLNSMVMDKATCLVSNSVDAVTKHAAAESLVSVLDNETSCLIKNQNSSAVDKFHSETASKSADYLMKQAIFGSKSIGSPNPDWPSPIMDITDDSSTSERPLMADSVDDAIKQRLDTDDHHYNSNKSMLNHKNIFGSNKTYYNNHVVTSQFSPTTINTYSNKSYQVLNNCHSKLFTPITTHAALSTQSSFFNSCASEPCLIAPRGASSSKACPPRRGLSAFAEHLSAPAATQSLDSLQEPLTSQADAASAEDHVQVIADAAPTQEEIDIWLSSIVSFQSSVAKMMIKSKDSMDVTPLTSCESLTTSIPAPTTVSVAHCSSVPTSSTTPTPSLVTSPSCVSTASPCISSTSTSHSGDTVPCLPKPSSLSLTSLPSTPRAGRKQVLIPRTSPTGSFSSSPPSYLPSFGSSQHPKSGHSTSSATPATPAKTYIARVSSSTANNIPESRALCLSELLHESLQALQQKLHSAHAKNHSELLSADRTLIELLAMQRLEQLQQPPAPLPAPPLHIAPSLPAHALLCPLIEPPDLNPVWVDLKTPAVDAAPPVPMQYRLLTVGKGSSNHVNLETYGHCNYISSNHACIFLDEYSGQYELVNYSSEGTTVDGGVYRCDLSGEKSVISQPPPNSLLHQVRESVQKYREAYIKNGAPGYCFSIEDETDEKKKDFDGFRANNLRGETEAVMTSRSDQVIRRCGCSRMSPDQRSRGGWEGPAILRHGSYIKFGCVKFVFSVVETASLGNWRTVTEEAYTKFYERECRERREQQEAAVAAAKCKEKEVARAKASKDKHKDKDQHDIKEPVHKENHEKERKKEPKKSKKDRENRKEKEAKSKS
ncbi:PHD finger protein 12-like [Hyalella azteca]|uniref:PHD finger protein 12-like n=1 Tax=Hyalella azteca TaxID=294128 RepID=A0A8B7NCL1_HYAAZ|nr:PHD finger protein 12-like [Hyalella azteca]